MLTRGISSATIFAAILVVGAAGQDWSQWRGPNRDGVVTAPLPKDWPAQLKQAWKVTVGEGYSSPVVNGARVFLISRQGEKEVVSCFQLATGRQVWQDGYPAPYQVNPAARRHGPGPKSTSVVGGGRLYTLGISGILSSYDAESGKLRWRKEFSSAYGATSPLYGTAMSPVVDRGLLIAHVGGGAGGALTAFDADSGAVKWAWKGDGPGYASPIVIDLEGTRQVVTQTEKMIVGVAAATGELLWSIPYTTPFVQNIVTPVLYKDMLILSGLRNPTMAVRVVRDGGKWRTEKLWENADASMYMSSPVLAGDLIFGMTNRNGGQLFCLDVRSGKLLWTGEPRQGENAALLVGSGVVLALTNNATLEVFRAGGKAFEPVRQYTVADSPTWAHPVPAGNGFLIKDLNSLALWTAE